MLERIEFPELFFGLVAPIGVDLGETVLPLKTLLEGFGYPKSAAFALHPDSIEVEGSSRVHYANYRKTKFTHFFGISPRRYRDFFEKSLRKNKASGRAQEWLGPKNEPRPILDVKVAIYLPLEKYVEDALRKSKATAIEALEAARTVKKALDDEEAEPRSSRKRKAAVRARSESGRVRKRR